jgi:uncharacterized membrane protein YjjB (DUF3815 family)
VSADVLQVLHHTACGGLAAAGFGVLFNAGIRTLAWCAVSGGLALAVRTVALQSGGSLVAASFVAALAVGAAAQMLQSRIGVSSNALAVVGCIPMIPGAVAARAILGLFAVTAQPPTASSDAFLAALENTLRVAFTIGSLGTGVAIPTLLMRARWTT